MTRRICLFVAVAALSFAGFAQEDFSTYEHKAHATFNYTGETPLTNFTALVKVAEGVGGFHYADCRADGQDVRFAGGDGVELPSEVGAWNPSGTSEFWVKIPVLTAPTRICIYWGNAGAGPRGDVAKTWDKNYAGVWHFEDEGAAVKDSSSYRNHGAAAFVSLRNAGVSGACRTFAGQKAGCGSGANLEYHQNTFTYELWFRNSTCAEGATYGGFFGIGDSGSSGSYNWGAHMGITSEGKPFARINDGKVVSEEVAAADVWHHAVLTYDSKLSSNKCKLYCDGVYVGSINSTFTDSAALRGSLIIGGWYYKGSLTTTTAATPGDYDEGRFSTTARSADYVAAVYTNMADYVNFVSVEANPATVIELVTTPAKSQYKVTITAGEGGEVSPSGDVFVEEGSDLVITATATDGTKAFYGWTGDCPEEQMFASSIVVRVDKPMSLEAGFGTIRRVTAEGGSAALAAAIADAADGDVVLVGKGTYAPDGTDWQINVAKPIAVRAEDGPGSVVFELAQSARGISVTKAGAVVEGFVISQAGNPTKGFVLNQTAGQVNDCVFSGTTNTSAGCNVLDVSGGRLQRCSILDILVSGTPGGATHHICAFSGGSTVIDGCAIRRNSRKSNWASDSAIVHLSSGVQLRNSLIEGNSFPDSTGNPGYHGGVYALSSTKTMMSIPLVEGCTIVGNSAKYRAGVGGSGIYDASGYAVVVNTIIEGNEVKDPTKGNNVDPTMPTAFLNTICDEIDPVDGCMQDSAKFVNAAAGDYRLAADSPAIDAGMVSAVSDDPVARDAAGNKRIRNQVLDIGALENWPTTLAVAGEPFEMGAPTPAYGSHACYDFGETITCTAPATWVSDDRLTTADCVGYRLERGGLVITGEDNSVVLTASNDLQSLTWLWKVASPLLAEDFGYVSSAFGSAIVSANVTGFGKGTKASAVVRYGTNPNALGSATAPMEVTELGTVEISLPLIRNGLTYYVKAVLTNDAGESFESDEPISFAQPEVKEPGNVSSAGYAAMDCLVAQWDGIDNAGRGVHDPTATAWADLTGNNHTLGNFVQGVTWTDNAFATPTTAYSKSSATITGTEVGVNDFLSYEVVFAADKAFPNSGAMVFATGSPTGGFKGLTLIKKTNNIGFQVVYNGRFFPCDYDTTGQLQQLYADFANDGTPDEAFYGGEELSGTTTYQENWGSGGFRLGYNSSGYPFYGRIFAIRLYNRKLTDAERERNYQIDMMRYVRGINGEIPLETKDDQLVLTLPESDGVRTVSLYSGKAYGGIDNWATTSTPMTVAADVTSASFALPEGWGTDAFYARAKIVEGDMTCWSATAFWEDPDGFVAVNGAPEKLRADEVSPGYGRLSVVAGGVTELTAPATTNTMEDGSRVFIGGWELHTKNPATGAMELVRTSESPLEGESASKCLYTHEHYSELVWIWHRQDCVTVTAGENGSVTANEVWADRGDTVTATATVDAGYRFLRWEGNLTDGEKVINPLSLEVRGAASVTAVFAPTVEPRAPTGEDFTSYANKAFVTFNYTGETTLTNFTALVKVSENVGGFRYADCRVDGQDVRFSLGDGEELPSEVGVWNPNGTSEFWVKLPELKPQTRILMYWGNASAGPRGDTAKAWDDYAGVWHLDDEGAVVKDSSSYRNHGASGFVSPRNAGIAGVCRTFDIAKNVWASCGAGYNPEFVGANAFTYEIWFKDVQIPAGMADGSNPAKIGFFGWGTGDWNIANFIGVNADGGVHVRSSNQRLNVMPKSGPIASGIWHHLAFAAYSPTAGTGDVKLYLDGELLGGYNFNPTVSAGKQASFQIGGWVCKGEDGYYDTGRPAGGSLDEGRVSTVQRSADYVAAVYRNIADTANFVTIEVNPEHAAGFIGETVVRDESGDGVRYVAEEGVHVFADGIEVDEAPSTAKLVALSTNAKREYKVTLEAGAGGTVEPSGEFWVEPGSNLVVTATATDAAKAFYKWTGNCPEGQMFASSIVVRVDKPMALAASFGTVRRVTAEGGAAALAAAITDAADGDVVLVGKGTYAPDGTGWQIAVEKPIAVRAEEGPGSVVFELEQSARGISVTAAGAVVEGFVISQAGNATTGYILNQTAGQVNDCIFSGTTNATRQLSALYVSGGRMQRCVVRDLMLTSGNGSTRKMCEITGAKTVVDGCVFTNNVDSGTYGASSATIVLSASQNSGATLRNSLVAGNAYPSGCQAGVHAAASVNGFPLIENCTIADNSARNADSAGAGLYDANRRALVVNTILEGNTVTQASKGMNVDITKATGFLNTICNEIEPVDGCKKSEAGFGDAANGDYSIGGTSPAVDAGAFTAGALDANAVDVAGSARVSGMAIDIGAYEYAPKGDEPLACSFGVSTQVGVDTLTVTFTPVVVGKTDGIVYLWSFGDGGSSTEASPTHTYSGTGNFTVKLVVSTYDGDVLKESASKEMANVVRVLPSKVYVRPVGESTPAFPYDTVETAANDLYTISASEYASGLVIDVDGTVARGDYLAEFRDPVKIVGHSPTSSVVSLSGSAGILAMNVQAQSPASGFEVRNVKFEVSGQNAAFKGRILEICGIVSNCVFLGAADNAGHNSYFAGAVRLLVGSRMTDSTVERLRGAWLQGAACARGIEIAGGDVIVDRCVVRKVVMESGTTQSDPTIIGVMGDYAPAPIIRNCFIVANASEMKSDDSSAGIGLCGPAVVENCTIVSNTSQQAGAGLVVKAAGAVIRNNVIWDNVVTTNYVGTAAVASNVFVAADIDCTLERNCSIDLKDVANNIAADPQLNWSANPRLPPYAIGRGSPCRNRGIREAWMDGATDISGRPRVFNGSPDVGCYENQSGGMVIIVK